MAFTTAELWAIKAEVGWSLLQTGATAYVGVSQLLDLVVNTNIDDEVSTTCTLGTAIAAASSPTPQTLPLADASSFSAGAEVYIDIDDRMERVRIQSLSGSDIVVLLSKAHSGTFPVSLFGPIPLVRELLHKIRGLKERMGSTYGEGVLKKVDELEWFAPGGNTSSTSFSLMADQLSFWRSELCAALALPNMWDKRSGRCTNSMTVY